MSAVCAHTSGNVGGNLIATRLRCLLGVIGSIGVPIFFILSGMLFKSNEQGVIIFLKKKINGLLIPWIVTGTMVWLYVVLRKGGISIQAWLDFVFGNGSYLYYMSMLMICYLLFWGKQFSLFKVLLLGCGSGIWILLECFDVVHTPNPYINPLNWIVYFLAGVLIAQYDLFAKLLEVTRRLKYVIIIAWIMLVVVAINLNIMIGYWHQSYLVFELISFGLLLYLAMVFPKVLWITEVGRQSFAIYLIHMPFAGVVNALFARFGIEGLLVLKPIIVIGVVMFCIIVLKYMETKVRFIGKIIRCIGVR